MNDGREVPLTTAPLSPHVLYLHSLPTFYTYTPQDNKARGTLKVALLLPAFHTSATTCQQSPLAFCDAVYFNGEFGIRLDCKTLKLETLSTSSPPNQQL